MHTWAENRIVYCLLVCLAESNASPFRATVIALVPLKETWHCETVEEFKKCPRSFRISRLSLNATRTLSPYLLFSITGWPIRLIASFCWQQIENCVLEKGVYSVTELLFWRQQKLVISTVQSGWSGCRTGNGKKLSRNQAQLGQSTYLAVA